MSVTNNQPVFNHESFGLSVDGQVRDQAQFCVGLQALIDRPLVAIREPLLVERVFKTISESDLANWPEAAKLKKLVADVKDRWVKVSLGDSFRHIPRIRLENDCGPKLKAQYTHNLADASKDELELSLPENATSEHFPEKLTESILSYLQTGEVSKDGFDENVLDLLSLALLHTQEQLVEEYVNFLTENLNFDNLDLIFTYARGQNCHQLKWTCLCFMQKNLEKVPKVLQDKYPDQFQLMKSLQNNQITLRFSPSGQTEIHIEYLSGGTTILLEQINQEIPIHSLVMLGRGTRKLLPFLKKFAPHLRELQELIIHSQDTADQEIPTLKTLFPKLTAFGNKAPFFQTFEEVETYLRNFTKPGAAEPLANTLTLRTLNLEHITTLDDSQMAKLTEYLQDIYHLSIKSNKITSVIAPKATEIHCDGCTALTTLEAPEATSVYCRSCTALTTLEVPEATSVCCTGCTALITLKAPNATNLSLSGYKALKTLEAPNATLLVGTECTTLTTLEIFKIIWFNPSKFKELTTLKMPAATEINCSFCKALKTLDAPNATYINSQDCTALTTLNAPSATEINCNGCTALTTLDAPNATEIRCCRCKALNTLDAPNATKIYCVDCSALTTLNAPNATEIMCSSCEALTTLDAPNATKIDCGWCPALTTLNAPKATEIHCHCCTELTTLDAPKATEIHCHWCTELTTLDAPNAKLLGDSRILIWLRRWLPNQIRSPCNAVLAFLEGVVRCLLFLIEGLFREMNNL